MLVLSRKEQQAVDFPAEGISVRVLRIQGSSVRLGFEAPSDCRIVREELLSDFEIHDKNELDSRERQVQSLRVELHRYRREVFAGNLDKAQEMFEGLLTKLDAIDVPAPLVAPA